MAAPSGKQYGAGFRHLRVYGLNASGLIDATSTTVYEGLQVVGARAFEFTIPDIRRIAHTGDDRLLAQTFLPRIEASNAVIRVARNDHDIYALISGTLSRTLGEAKTIGYGTSQQGEEPNLGLLMYQLTQDAVSKVNRYMAYIFPSARGIINPAALGENANEFQFNIVPNIVTSHLWGPAFTLADDGFTTAEMIESQTVDVPLVAAWKGDGVATKFLFGATHQATSTVKIHAVTVNGVIDATATKATDGVTPTTMPVSGDIVACFYETAAI